MLEPAHGLYLVKRDAVTEVVKNGLVQLATTQEPPNTGTILERGLQVNEYSKGDRILFAKYAGTEVEHNGEQFLLVKQDDVLARIV